MKHESSRIIAVLVIFGLAATSIMPFLIYSGNLWNQQGSTYVGDPIDTTIFSSYAAADGSSEIFPDAFDTRTDRPLIYETDYTDYLPQIMVDYEEALEIAEDWLYRIGPPMINWTMFSDTNSTSPPSRTFYFSHVDFLAFVTVDSVTGSIIEYESSYLHDFDPTVLTLEESEQLVQDFLTAENISLPSTAHYIKGEPYDCQRFFSLVFQEYVGPVKVEDSQIMVRASAFTRGISYYRNSWVGIDSIDLTGVLDPEVARRNAAIQVPEMSEVTELHWISSELALVEIEPEDSSIDRTWRLSWTLLLEDNGDPEYEAEIFVDAFSGNTYGFRSTETSFEDIMPFSSLYSTETLFTIAGVSILLLTGVVIFTLYRWKIEG